MYPVLQETDKHVIPQDLGCVTLCTENDSKRETKGNLSRNNTEILNEALGGFWKVLPFAF